MHCYINIPDTGGRDSLYQAEARQCKNILETIENNYTKNIKYSGLDINLNFYNHCTSIYPYIQFYTASCIVNGFNRS